jgi:hypothetical protein
VHEKRRLRVAVAVVAAAALLLGAAYAGGGPSKSTKNARAGCKVAWQDGLNKGIYDTSVRQIVTKFRNPLPQGISRLVDDLAADPGREVGPGAVSHAGAEARLVLACYNSGYLRLSTSDASTVQQIISSEQQP